MAGGTMTYLWLDLGNTRLKYWIINNGKTLAFDAKEHLKAPNELLLGLATTLMAYQPNFIGISSVLGWQINQKITQTLTQLNTPFEFAQVTSQHPLLTSHYHPKELGVDRWLQMLGLAGQQKHCIIGCGTALTIDLVDKGVHLGGYILPNAYMQRHALYSGTQQIAVKAGRFDSTSLGTTTFDAVNHGILFGIIATVQGIRHAYPDYELVLTGGGARLIDCHLSPPAIIIDDLLLMGLQRYFQVDCC